MRRITVDQADYPPIQRATVLCEPVPPAHLVIPSQRYTETGRRSRDRYLRRNYGIGLDRHDALLMAQGGVCAICKQAPSKCGSLHVDHCHITGMVRGLLCTHCNRGVGGFRDNPQWCQSASRYLLGE